MNRNRRKAKAGQAEIIRTVQKDLQYTEKINENVAEIAQYLSQNNRNYNVIKLGGLLSVLSKIAYHGFASINTMQTLGEEYTGIVQADKNIRLPHKLTQLLAIFLEFGGLQLTTKLLNTLEQRVRNDEDILPDAKQTLLDTIKYSKFLLPYIHAIHRGVFYLNGGSYQISKRFTGINYILLRFWLNQKQDVKGFRILGIVTLLHTFISLIIRLKSLRAEENQLEFEPKNQIGNNSIPSSSLSSKRCILCLEPRQNSATTRCGHIFCWNCICEWLQCKSECPTCREPLKPFTVIPLMNLL
jgi:peroxin-10